MAARAQNLRQNALVGAIALLLKYCLEHFDDEVRGVLTGFRERNDRAIGESAIEWPVFRMQRKIHAALLAPALQLEHAITLARGWTLRERQTSSLRKNLAEIDRPPIGREVMLARNR